MRFYAKINTFYVKVSFPDIVYYKSRAVLPTCLHVNMIMAVGYYLDQKSIPQVLKMQTISPIPCMIIHNRNYTCIYAYIHSL